jgi:hypothetical protein
MIMYETPPLETVNAQFVHVKWKYEDVGYDRYVNYPWLFVHACRSFSPSISMPSSKQPQRTSTLQTQTTSTHATPPNQSQSTPSSSSQSTSSSSSQSTSSSSSLTQAYGSYLRSVEIDLTEMRQQQYQFELQYKYVHDPRLPPSPKPPVRDDDDVLGCMCVEDERPFKPKGILFHSLLASPSSPYVVVRMYVRGQHDECMSVGLLTYDIRTCTLLHTQLFPHTPQNGPLLLSNMYFMPLDSPSSLVLFAPSFPAANSMCVVDLLTGSQTVNSMGTRAFQHARYFVLPQKPSESHEKEKEKEGKEEERQLVHMHHTATGLWLAIHDDG